MYIYKRKDNHIKFGLGWVGLKKNFQLQHKTQPN